MKQMFKLLAIISSIIALGACTKKTSDQVQDLSEMTISKESLGQSKLANGDSGESGERGSVDQEGVEFIEQDDPIDPIDNQSSEDSEAQEDEDEADDAQELGFAVETSNFEVPEGQPDPYVSSEEQNREFEDDSSPENKVLTIDDSSTTVRKRGDWVLSDAVPGYTGDGYHHSSFDGERKSFVYPLARQIEASGFYKLYAHWTAHTNRASNALHRVILVEQDQDGNWVRKVKAFRVNQRSSNIEGNYIGSYYFHKNIDVEDLAHPANKYQKVRIVVDDRTDGFVIADGIRLEWVGHQEEGNLALSSPIHLDTEDFHYVRKKGDWKTGTAVSGFDGDFYLHDLNGTDFSGDEQFKKNMRYAPNFAEAGDYEIYVKFTPHGNRASNALYVVRSWNEAEQKIQHHNIFVDQTNPSNKNEDGWVKLVHTTKKGGETSLFHFQEGQSFKSGALILRRTKKTDGYLIADSVKFVKK